jgi:SRSO17 transposase
MTAPSFVTFVTVLTGWLFAPRHTVTATIVAAGRAARKHHSAYHRLFASARWSLDELGLAVAALVLPWLGTDTIFVALDDTLARKHGLKIFGVGMHHDPLLSTRQTALMNWGHSWVIVGLIVQFPFHPYRCFCLPILFRLYRSQQTVRRQGGAYRTRPELAVELLDLLGARLAARPFHVVADSTYGGQSVLKQLPPNADLTSRLLLDARLYEAAPPRRCGQNGRPRKRGKRLPTPRQMLQSRAQRVSVDVYGRHDCVRLVECVAYLHALPTRAVRVVAVAPLSGGRPWQAFYSTCVNATAVELLRSYARRWSIEQAFQESKMHLGFEQPQGWTRRAVERTAPTAMLLYSLIVLWFAGRGHQRWHAPQRSWYRRKRWPAFTDMLALLRWQSLQQEVLHRTGPYVGMRKPLRDLMNTLQCVV